MCDHDRLPGRFFKSLAEFIIGVERGRVCVHRLFPYIW